MFLHFVWRVLVYTNNKFTAEHVLLRWQYIMKECEKRGIRNVSFGGDGDSRLMKAMRISVGLFSKQIESHTSFTLLKSLSIPSSWSEWFWSHRPSTVVYVQDVVHIAVKLKSRLIKPSVLLPMGSFVAGVHHLQILQKKHLEKMYMDLENETLIIKIGKILMLFYII